MHNYRISVAIDGRHLFTTELIQDQVEAKHAARHLVAAFPDAGISVAIHQALYEVVPAKEFFA